MGLTSHIEAEGGIIFTIATSNSRLKRGHIKQQIPHVRWLQEEAELALALFPAMMLWLFHSPTDE